MALPHDGSDSAGELLDTSRIDYLLASSALLERKVVQVGLGSGGAVVMERLAMCGVGSWTLIDPDVLEPVNLVKHPFRRADVGAAKVDVAERWIRDRNPGATVHTSAMAVQDVDSFEQIVTAADLLICAVDNAPARDFINTVAFRTGCPAAFGMVFRTGLGGEVYTSIPGATGCRACLDLYVATNGTDLDMVPDLTAEEENKIYGLGETDFRASSLGVDIGVVAALHAHLCLLLLAADEAPMLSRPAFNWLTIGLRRRDGLFESLYEVSRRLLRPQVGCGTCGSGTL